MLNYEEGEEPELGAELEAVDESDGEDDGAPMDETADSTDYASAGESVYESVEESIHEEGSVDVEESAEQSAAVDASAEESDSAEEPAGVALFEPEQDYPDVDGPTIEVEREHISISSSRSSTRASDDEDVDTRPQKRSKVATGLPKASKSRAEPSTDVLRTPTPLPISSAPQPDSPLITAAHVQATPAPLQAATSPPRSAASAPASAAAPTLPTIPPNADMGAFKFPGCSMMSYDAHSHKPVHLFCCFCGANVKSNNQYFNGSRGLVYHMATKHGDRIDPGNCWKVKDHTDKLGAIVRPYCMVKMESVEAAAMWGRGGPVKSKGREDFSEELILRDGTRRYRRLGRVEGEGGDGEDKPRSWSPTVIDNDGPMA